MSRKQEIVEILSLLETIGKRTARIQSFTGKLSTVSEESFSDIDAEYVTTELEEVVGTLETVIKMVASYSRPIIESSRLWKNGRGQYETTRGYCFREGSEIEVYVPYIFDPNNYHWDRTRLKYDGKKYYLADYPELPLAGLPVRVRAGDKP